MYKYHNGAHSAGHGGVFRAVGTQPVGTHEGALDGDGDVEGLGDGERGEVVLP